MAVHHAKPGEIVDLTPLRAELTGAKTTAVVKTASFETIRLIISAGSVLPQHRVAGAITLHCLEGKIELGIDPAPVFLKANCWVYLEGGAPHSVKAIENSSLLLTIIL